MKRRPALSAQRAHDERATAYFKQWRKTCGCSSFELRQESHGMCCACGAVLVLREVA